MRWARHFWTTVFLVVSGLSFLNGQIEPGTFALGFAAGCLIALREDDNDDGV